MKDFMLMVWFNWLRILKVAWAPIWKLKNIFNSVKAMLKFASYISSSVYEYLTLLLPGNIGCINFTMKLFHPQACELLSDDAPTKKKKNTLRRLWKLLLQSRKKKLLSEWTLCVNGKRHALLFVKFKSISFFWWTNCFNCRIYQFTGLKDSKLQSAPFRQWVI